MAVLPAWAGIRNERSRFDLSASGHSLGEVLAALGRASGVTLTASAGIAEERIGLQLRGQPLPQLMRSVARLFGYTWKESSSGELRQYRLEPTRRTRGLEAYLRRIQLRDGLPELRQSALRSLDALNGSPFTRQEATEHHFGDSARAGLFLSALTEAQAEAMLHRGSLQLAPTQLSPLQRELLQEYVRVCLARNLDLTPEERERQIERLAVEGLGTRSVFLRAAPTRHGVELAMHVPDSGQETVALRSSRLEWPPGLCPYDYAEPAHQERARPVRTGGAVHAEVPGDWSEVVVLIARLFGKPVLCDWLTSDPYTAVLRSKARGAYQAPDREAFLTALCERWLMLWWEDEEALYLQDRAWYLARLQEPPLSVRRRLELDVRSGRLRRATLDALADLPRPQLRTLVEQMEAEELFAVSESGLADWLSIYRLGSLAQREAVLRQGIGPHQLTPSQWQLLRALPPDSIFYPAGEVPPDRWVFRLTQNPEPPDTDEHGKRAHLRITCSAGGEAVVIRVFRTSARPLNPALVCRLSGE
ncbi:MAG: hypothetical protein ACK47B_16450 [Armatimonadota bacterium]